MLSTFPLCVKGWLEIRGSNCDDTSPEEWKASGIITSNWHSKFCILMENDSKFYLFNDESNAERLSIPSHIAQCRLDNELNVSHMVDSCIDDVSMTSSRNFGSDKYASNLSLAHGNISKAPRRGGFFRNGSRFFRLSKGNRKLSDQTNNSNVYENSQSAKSVSNLKRSLSLNRINRKKSEEKFESKNSHSKLKNSSISQSTGDLTLNTTSMSVIRHDLTKDTIISEVHPSLVGERLYCFSVSSLSEECSVISNFESKVINGLQTKRYFAASSMLERQCWMKRLQLTLKPNMENENRLCNSLKLTIFESKQLPTPKRRYFCEVRLDDTLWAKTTSKIASHDGCVFWAEELVLNNIPIFKTLAISLYKEGSSGKELKKKKKKHQNQCIGQLFFNLAMLSSKNDLQSWFNLRSPNLLPDLNSSSLIQLRIKLHYQSLKVLPNDAYLPLYEITTDNYLELIQLLEKNLPVKLKEEIANCLVNIHEKNGTIIQFLILLISEEINNVATCSMVLRANTIITKIIESHMKLVGFQYLQNMLHSFIRDVMYRDVTIEVDPSRYDVADMNNEKLLIDNQHLLTKYVKQIWSKIYQSRYHDFPKQLKSIFSGWRKRLTCETSSDHDQEGHDLNCDVIISGCIFLRLLCPAILSPHLFGLVSFFSEKAAVQRTLTLIAKSLQSLANFATFGDKEQFMTFMNSCFEEEMPLMRDFLRSISSVTDYDGDVSAINKDIHYYGSVVDLPIEMASLHKCLVSDGVKDCINNKYKNYDLKKLPDIINNISHQLISFNVSQSSSSFFSVKKLQNSNDLPPDQRRFSGGQILNVKTFEIGKYVKEVSPPLLGSPVLASTLLDTVSEYALHSDDVWQRRSESSNTSLSKSSQSQKFIYSTKPQYNLGNISKSLVSRRCNNSQENGLEINGKNNAGENSSQFSHSVSCSETKLKSSIPKYLQLNKTKASAKSSQSHTKKGSTKVFSETQYDKVNDSFILKHYGTRRSSQSMTPHICDEDFYRENPLYDFVDITMTKQLSLGSNRYFSNSIDKYFDIRSQINVIEQNLKEAEAEVHQDDHLIYLRKQLDCMRKQVHKDQANDLKQLNTMLHFSKNSAIDRIYSRSSSTHLLKSAKDNTVMIDVLDDVINSITLEGAGLDEAHENIRRHLKKVKPSIKYGNNKPIFARESSLEMIINSEHNMESVAIDLCDISVEMVNSSPNVTHSLSSSNCSSLMSGLI